MKKLVLLLIAVFISLPFLAYGRPVIKVHVENGQILEVSYMFIIELYIPEGPEGYFIYDIGDKVFFKCSDSLINTKHIINGEPFPPVWMLEGEGVILEIFDTDDLPFEELDLKDIKEVELLDLLMGGSL